jgi:hypothetical protein
MKTTGADGALGTQNFYVIRDGAKVALVSWPGEAEGRGLPSCYSTNGLLVALDPDNPGGLILVEGGHPDVTVTYGDQGGVMQFGHTADGKGEASILLDAAAILKTYMEKARRTNYDPASGVVQADTGRTVLSMVVPTDPAQQTILGFTELAMGNKEFGVWVKVAQSAAPSRDYLSVTADAVRKLGLPLRTPGKEFDAKRLWLNSTDASRDPKLRRASEGLESLFVPRPKGNPAGEKVEPVTEGR